MIKNFIKLMMPPIVLAFVLFLWVDGVLAHKTEQAIALTPEERAWLEAHPEIVLGYTDTLEPEVIANPDGTYSGMLVDFLDALNKRLGIEIGLRLYPIPEVIDKAKKKIVDGILNLHPEYADRLGLIKTRVYWPSYLAVFAHKGVSFRSPEDFADKRVAIIDKVHITEKFMDQHGKPATILKVADALEGLQSVEKGATDFFLGFSINSFIIPKYQLLSVVPTHVFIDSPEWFGIGIRADWPELVSILNKGISGFSEEEIHAIIAKWSYLPKRQEVITLTLDEQTWLNQKHTVRVRISEHEPYLFSENGKPVGIAADLLNSISEHTGINFDFTKRIHIHTEAMRRLIEHEGPDIIPSLAPTPEREKVILFTKPYVSSPKFIFTRDDAPFIFSMANLSGKTVAVIEGYVTHQLLVKNYPDITLLIYKSNKDALIAVSSGKVFAFIGSLLSTATMINKYGLPNLKASAPSDLPEATVAMGVRKDWPELRDIINKGYDAIPEREKFAIINKWSSVKIDYGVRPRDVLKWVLVVGGSAFGILLLFVFWNWNLRRQVHLRTAELDSSIQSLRAEIAERKQAEGERDRILDSSHDLICIAGMDGYFKYVNPAWEKNLNYTQDELLNKPFQDFIHPDDHSKTDAELEKLAVGQQTLDFENRYIHKDGMIRYISWVATSLLEERAIYCIGRDITARKEAQEELQESEEKFRHLVEQSPLSIQLFGLDGQIVLVNEAWKELWGFSEEMLPEVLEKYNILEDEQVRELGVMPDIEKAFRGERVTLAVFEYDSSITMEKLEVTVAEGNKRWIQVRFYPVKNSKGEVVNVVGIEEDLTNRKQAEMELQQYQERLKALASQLTIAEERERRTLAADLHDHVGHSLALARMQLNGILEAQSELERSMLVKDISHILLKSLQDTRSLIFELSSPSLNEIGLGAAISEWLEENVGKRYGLKTEFIDEIDEKFRKTLDVNVRAVLFRNVRELFTNIIKHAKAEKASVYLKAEDGIVTVIIEDDGIGFDPQAATPPGEEKSGFGLFSIRERMADLGGSFDIRSEPGKGCKAIMSVPIDKGVE